MRRSDSPRKAAGGKFHYGHAGMPCAAGAAVVSGGAPSRTNGRAGRFAAAWGAGSQFVGQIDDSSGPAAPARGGSGQSSFQLPSASRNCGHALDDRACLADRLGEYFGSLRFVVGETANSGCADKSRGGHGTSERAGRRTGGVESHSSGNATRTLSISG